MPGIHAVTGAFGYSGRYIATRLLEQGHQVITLTGSPHREHPFGDRVPAYPFHFDDPDALRQSLRGVEVLYNTYWVRFNHRDFRFADAVRNTITLFEAARDAGVERIVHVSITNPDEHCDLEYFSGKGRLERALRELGPSYAILRPTVLFGKEDILINNIAWALRTLPVFGVFGDGQYRIQPIYVDDLAALAVAQGQSRDHAVVEAIGPETFTFRELVTMVGRIIDCPRPVIGVPPWFGWLAGQVLGLLTGDVMITWDEIRGLMQDRLYINAPPAGETALSEWAEQHRETLGRHYTSELARRRGAARG